MSEEHSVDTFATQIILGSYVLAYHPMDRFHEQQALLIVPNGKRVATVLRIHGARVDAQKIERLYN
jgi:hypothetical protein